MALSPKLLRLLEQIDINENIWKKKLFGKILIKPFPDYLIWGLKQMAWFAGMVHGVVVHTNR